MDGYSEGSGNGSGTDYPISLPSGTAGSRGVVLAFIASVSGTTHTWPSPWIEIFDDGTGQSAAFAYCEDLGSDSVTAVGAVADSDYIYQCVRDESACHVTATTEASGTSTTPDPPSHTPGAVMGAYTYRWLAWCIHLSVASPTPPTNYSAVGDVSAFGATLAMAERQLNGTSEDPGVFTFGSSQGWGARTFAFWPSDKPIPRSAGAINSGTGAITLAENAGAIDGDLQIMQLETDQSETPTCTGWSAAPSSPQATGSATTDTKNTILYRIRSGAGTLTTNDPGDHVVGRIWGLIRGSFDPDNPFNTSAGGTDESADTSASVPGSTTTRDGCLIIASITHGNDPGANGTANYSGWTNGDLTQVTELLDNTRTAGNGGGFGVAGGYMGTAGSYGATTATLAVASLKGLISLAINPPPTMIVETPTPGGATASGNTPLAIVANTSQGAVAQGASPIPGTVLTVAGAAAQGTGPIAAVSLTTQGAIAGGNAPTESSAVVETPSPGGATASGNSPTAIIGLTAQGAAASGNSPNAIITTSPGGADAQGVAPFPTTILTSQGATGSGFDANATATATPTPGGADAQGTSPSPTTTTTADGANASGVEPSSSSSATTGGALAAGFDVSPSVSPSPGGATSGAGDATALVFVTAGGATSGGNAPSAPLAETPDFGGAISGGNAPNADAAVDLGGAATSAGSVVSYVSVTAGGALSGGVAPTEIGVIPPTPAGPTPGSGAAHPVRIDRNRIVQLDNVQTEDEEEILLLIALELE